MASKSVTFSANVPATAAPISAATRFSSSQSISARTTRQPSRASARAEALPIAPAPPVMNAVGMTRSVVSHRSVFGRIMGALDAVFRDIAAMREPDDFLELLQVADHLLEGEGHVRSPAELGVDQRVDAAGTAALRLLAHEVERGLETLEGDLAVRLA